MEKEVDDSLKRRCRKTLTRLLSSDDGKHGFSADEVSHDEDKEVSRRSSSPMKNKREHSQSPRIKDKSPLPYKYNKKHEDKHLKSPKKEGRDRKVSISETKEYFTQSQPTIQFSFTSEDAPIPQKDIRFNSLDPLERKSARRSQSANDAVIGANNTNTSSSIAIAIAHKKNMYNNTPPVVRNRRISEEVSENNNKTFKITIIKGLSHSGEVLSIKPKNYTTYDLVLSDYKGIEVIDEDAQYYIVYSKLGFGLHHSINILDSSLSEEKIIDVYRNHFPVVTKSRNYVFSAEGFKSIFCTLMYTIYKNAYDEKDVLL